MTSLAEFQAEFGPPQPSFFEKVTEVARDCGAAVLRTTVSVVTQGNLPAEPLATHGNHLFTKNEQLE